MAQMQQQKMQEEYARQLAAQKLKEGAAAEERILMGVERDLSSLNVLQAASGVAIDYGSPQEVAAGAAREGALKGLQARYDAASAAHAHSFDALQAKTSRNATLLGGLIDIGNAFAKAEGLNTSVKEV